MGNLLIFCLIIGLCGAFVGVLFDFRTIGLTLCVIANCLLFMGASIGGMIAFAKGLKATQTYQPEIWSFQLYRERPGHRVQLPKLYGECTMPDTDALPEIRLKCPDLASIIPGRRFLYRAKVGGERQTVTVTASTAPYPRDFGKGRKAMYVTVYGYEGKWTVPASKLRIAEKV